jgi:hypothetical protein
LWYMHAVSSDCSAWEEEGNYRHHIAHGLQHLSVGNTG